MTTTCDTPRCGEPGRWQVAATGRRVCAEHIPDGQAVTLAEPRPADPPPVDEGILAARCPPGWRRSPLDGRPVMPLVGRLLFPGAPDEVPGVMDVGDAAIRLRSWLSAHSKAEPFDVIDDAVDLIGGVLLDAAMAKKRGGEGLSQNTEVRLSALVESMLRTCGTVRIVRTGVGWEEAGRE